MAKAKAKKAKAKKGVQRGELARADWTQAQPWIRLADATEGAWMTPPEVCRLIGELTGRMTASPVGLGRLLTPWAERKPGKVGSCVVPPHIWVYRRRVAAGTVYRLASVSIPGLVPHWQEVTMPR